jgi:hypothetical protein
MNNNINNKIRKEVNNTIKYYNNSASVIHSPLPRTRLAGRQLALRLLRAWSSPRQQPLPRCRQQHPSAHPPGPSCMGHGRTFSPSPFTRRFKPLCHSGRQHIYLRRSLLRRHSPLQARAGRNLTRVARALKCRRRNSANGSACHSARTRCTPTYPATTASSVVIPVPRCAEPSCDCGAKMGAADYVPCLHATQDCALRNWKELCCCPGFFENGQRDPAQWRGNNLTRQAKDDWISLIARKDLQLLSELAGVSHGLAPNFSEEDCRTLCWILISQFTV